MSERPKYQVGQVVYHRKYNYRGVVVEIDACFHFSDRLDEEVILTETLRRSPWYRVLVNRGKDEAYVAETLLEADLSQSPVDNPDLPLYFDAFQCGHYLRTRPLN